MEISKAEIASASSVALSAPQELMGAEIMVKALHFAFGVDETYAFEIAPQIDAAWDLIKELGIANG